MWAHLAPIFTLASIEGRSGRASREGCSGSFSTHAIKKSENFSKCAWTLHISSHLIIRKSFGMEESDVKYSDGFRVWPSSFLVLSHSHLSWAAALTCQTASFTEFTWLHAFIFGYFFFCKVPSPACAVFSPKENVPSLYAPRAILGL